MLPHAEFMAVYDAKAACLRRLQERRTRGRMRLYLAVDALLAAVAAVLLANAKAVRS